VRMRGKVERRAAQVLRGWKDVPEHLADGDDFHPKSILDHIQQPFATRFPFVACEDMRANFNEARKHVKY